ncbi:MAG: DUF4391 domain-containing protein [Rectinema sp.]|jgi:hypothetical protein
MFGLPKSTEINKPLPKKAVFDRFKPKPDDRRLFDEQINRMAIVAEISPQTVSVAASGDVSAVFVILVTLKVPECDKKNIALLSKLIDQRMIFALRYEGDVRLAVYRAERVLLSQSKPLEEWKLSLSGLDLGAVWENIIAEIGGVDLAGGKDLDETIAASERRDKLTGQIAALEQKAMNEQQPRRKWEDAEEIKRLKAELEELNNG